MKDYTINLPKEPILIIDDDKATVSLLGKYCQLLGFEYQTAKNGQEALSLVKKVNFSVFIIDLMMPVMDGRAFIKEIKSVLHDAVIIVQTNSNDPKTIIETMKLNIFDYILKPIEPEIFKQVLLKSLEYKHLLDFKTQHQLYAEKKIQSQMDWLLYKETLLIKDQVKQNASPILNLNTSLNSGAGIGALVTLVDLLKSTAEKKDDNKYLVDTEVLELIFENGEYCKKQIESLSEFSRVLSTKFDLKPFTCSKLMLRIQDIKDSLQELFYKKNLEFVLPTEKSQCNLILNENMLMLAIHEIIVNAYKYSIENSKIYLLTNFKDGYLWLCFKNTIDASSGIPSGYEKLVIEPFFRLVKVVDESVVDVEKFSIGLGLAVVDFVVKKHNGLFFIHEMADHTQTATARSVFTEILLPYTL